jgi:hypothetical protein
LANADVTGASANSLNTYAATDALGRSARSIFCGKSMAKK